MPDLALRNYHTHTWRCHHAIGEVADYCDAAARAGLQVLGMSDHTPMPDGRWPEMRMTMDQLDGYLLDINAARDAYPELTILKSVEVEYVPEFADFCRDELLGARGLDYLVAGAHSFPFGGRWLSIHGELETDPRQLRAYTDYLIESIQSDLFAFIAHPDLFGIGYLPWDAETEACSRDILAAAAACDVPLEINGYGMRKPPVDAPDGPRWKYPVLPFWELAREYDVRVLANSDAHRPEDVDASIADGLAIANRLGLELADLSHLHPEWPASLT